MSTFELVETALEHGRIVMRERDGHLCGSEGVAHLNTLDPQEPYRALSVCECGRVDTLTEYTPERLRALWDGPLEWVMNPLSEELTALVAAYDHVAILPKSFAESAGFLTDEFATWWQHIGSRLGRYRIYFPPLEYRQEVAP